MTDDRTRRVASGSGSAHASGIPAGAACHPPLDPVVQTFLDRRAEGLDDADDADDVISPRVQLVLPIGFRAAPLPVLVYLHGPSTGSRRKAIQTIADGAGVAVLSMTSESGPSCDIAKEIVEELDALSRPFTGILDPDRIAILGEGVAALDAIGLAVRPEILRRISLLLLLTPVLGRPAPDCEAQWPHEATPEEYADGVADLPGASVWPGGFARERLMRLPPIVLVAAEADPFRDGAEDFARRMIAAEHDVSAVRVLGTIHGFTWLPWLQRSRGTLDANAVICRALTDALTTKPLSETVPC